MLFLIRPAILFTIIYFTINQLYLSLYGIKFSDILAWWWKNIIWDEHKWHIIVALIFGGSAVMLLFGLLNFLYVSLVGVKQELMYLGDKGSNIEIYHNHKDPKKSEVEYFAHKLIPNTTIEQIFNYKLFLKDPLGLKNSLTKVATERGLLNIITFSFIFMGFIGLMVMSMFAEPYIDANTELVPHFAHKSIAEINTTILSTSKTWLNIGTTIFGLIVIVILINIKFKHLEEEFEKSRTQNEIRLPDIYSPGQTLEGSVVTIENDQEEYKARESDLRRRDRKGIPTVIGRYATVKFTQQLDYPIYVSFYFNSNDHADWENRLKEFKKSGRPITVYINDNYEIEPRSLN